VPISSPNPTFDHLLESSHRDDSNKWSNIGFGEEITQGESIEVNLMNLIWSPDTTLPHAAFLMQSQGLILCLPPVNFEDCFEDCK